MEKFMLLSAKSQFSLIEKYILKWVGKTGSFELSPLIANQIIPGNLKSNNF
jgi:hypothetical protein